eukprot:UN09702
MHAKRQHQILIRQHNNNNNNQQQQNQQPTTLPKQRSRVPLPPHKRKAYETKRDVFINQQKLTQQQQNQQKDFDQPSTLITSPIPYH